MFKLPDLKKKSIKDLSAIFSATVANQVIGIVRGFFVAKFLGPVDFGIVKTIQLITMLDKFGSLGLKTVATREVAHIKGEGDIERADIVRNTAYTGEFLLVCLLFIAGLASTLFFESVTIITAILLASGQLFSNKILGIFNTEAIIEKKIVLYSKVLFWSNLLSSLVIIIFVPYLKIYAVLGIPIFAAIISCAVYWHKIGAKLKFHFDLNEMKRLLKIGIPVTMSTLAFGSYRYSERILVGSLLGIESLGIFSLAMMPMMHTSNLTKQVIKIRGVHLYELLGQRRFSDVHKIVVKETTILFIIALITIPIMWFTIDIVISLFLSSYMESIAAAKIFLLALPFRLISCYAAVVIMSSVVNKQIYAGPVNFTGTILFVLSVFILRHFGLLSIVNIVIADVICQSIVQLLFVVLYKKHFVNVYVNNGQNHKI